ncbi:charged multivesicular body protein 4b-like protein [Dinothrombium tinctorium]|uniref:Charged multivesicular body protein 4b-like protein n=1 Tax=Dinothrombium tinctorium TaxID=1965070 RepID=A0A3S3P653_9ACAR|nr:charged multivesicular body protein 4b-like protein [Dinothrombium tinctorium]RWS07943.1 charged multivesicular body protein 4b-like protein [Dinothrombium tinctorium]RWS08795.1 charged multivesicular body protein 4b-like protein [Dinothrombium tinctorium]RWS08804.1 charged multivesicular body protein 4b-like protein [Dinothrombium tinctorium]
MAFLGKLFGGKQSGKQATPTPAEAIQKLREVEEMLMKKQEYLEKKVQEEIDIIKKNGTRNKRVSLAALKRKKRLEKQLEQIDGTTTTIEYQREALENANTNAEVLKIMGFAAKALKQSHNNMDIDSVEDLMDEIKEQNQIADEIQQVISNPIGFDRDVDEDELMKELEEMDQEELDNKLLNVERVPVLPEVPNEEPEKTAAKGAVGGSSKKAAKEEDDDMRELEAWASSN